MRRFSSLAWRSLRARKLRSVLTIVGVALGVAVLFASLAASSTMDAAVDRAAADEMGHATLRVHALEERGLGPDTVAAVKGVPVVAVAAPGLERKTYLAASQSQSPSAALPAPVTVLGVDPAVEPQVHDMPLSGGRLLAASDTLSALITQTLATQERLSLGDSITLNGGASLGPQAYSIVGILSGDGSLPDAGGRLVVVPLASAQALFDTTGVTRVDLVARPGVAADEVAREVETAITTEPYLLQKTSDTADALRAETADFRGTLLLVAAVVLFAGAFLIFNTLAMTVTERAREVGLLRAAGTTRSQVMGFVLLQALVLGAVGSVVGVAAGVGLAALTLAWVSASGPISLSAPDISPAPVLLALVIGIAVTLAASLEPAWRAGRIPPVEALRRSSTGAVAGEARLRWLVLVFGVLAVCGAVRLATIGRIEYGDRVVRGRRDRLGAGRADGRIRAAAGSGPACAASSRSASTPGRTPVPHLPQRGTAGPQRPVARHEPHRPHRRRPRHCPGDGGGPGRGRPQRPPDRCPLAGRDDPGQRVADFHPADGAGRSDPRRDRRDPGREVGLARRALRRRPGFGAPAGRRDRGQGLRRGRAAGLRLRRGRPGHGLRGAGRGRRGHRPAVTGRRHRTSGSATPSSS